MSDLLTLALIKQLKGEVAEAKQMKQIVPERGPQGPKGEQGDRGPEGPQGESIKGDPGKDGVDGKDGEDGVGIASVEESIDGDLVITLTNGEEHVVELNFLGERNKQGDTYVSISKPGSSSGDLQRTFTAGEALAKGDLTYYAADGKMYKTSATTESATSPMLGIALNSANTDDVINFLLTGFAQQSVYSTSDKLYLSTTSGAISNSRPSASGQFVRVVGYAISSEEIYFNPDATWVGLEA